jgi:VanZ like family
MGGRDFPRLDRSYVCRAHIAIHCPVFALAQTRYFGGDACVDSLHSSEVCARGRVRCSGAALGRAATLMTNFKRSIPIRYLSLLSVCLLVAATDEFHQTFVASRGASVRDIMIDSGGAILGLLAGSIFRMSRSAATKLAAEREAKRRNTITRQRPRRVIRLGNGQR